MNNLSSTVSRRKFTIIFVGIMMIMGLGLGTLALAQDEPVVGDIFVNSISDVEKKNDGRCTLREAIIAANKDKPSGGKSGECAAGKPDGPDGQGDIIVLQVADTDPDTQTDTDIFSLTRTDNGNEDSSTTGDLDIKSNITIITSSPGPVIIEGGEGFSDRIFHVLNGSLTLDQVTIRGGKAKVFGGGIYVEGGRLNLTNSTLTDNHAGTSGGALYNNAIANLNYVTVKDNTVGDTDSPVDGGLVNSVDVLDPTKTLVVNNSYIDSNDCAGQIGGLEANNLFWDASACPAALEEDSASLDNDKLEKIIVLGDSSLKPAIFALLEGSVALDRAGACIAEDQLKTERAQGDACDIGAYEKIVVDLPPVADDRTVAGTEDISLDIDVSGDVFDPEGQLKLDSLVIIDDVDFGTLNKTGSFTFSYIPATNFFGIDSFTYQIADIAGQLDTATLTIEIGSDGYIEVTNVCDSESGSLREAIITANNSAEDTIVFDILDTNCGENMINLLSPLPDLTVPVTIDGLLTDGHFTQTNTEAYITLNGGATEGNNFSGITIQGTAGGSEILNLIILNFGGSGIVIGDVGSPSSGNKIHGNTIQNNGTGSVSSPGGITLDDGVTIIEGVNNKLTNNNITGNADTAVDLGGDGETPNDFGDPDDGANWVQNYPDITRAGPNPGNNKLLIEGWLNSQPTSTYTLQFFSSPSCDSGDLTLLNNSEIQVTTDSLLPDYDAGNVYFSLTMPDTIPEGYAIRGTATDTSGNTSEFSPCVRVGVGNDTWIAAKRLNNGDDPVNQYIDLFGQSRWYKIKVNPDNKVKVTLTNLPKNYDVVIFKDILGAYNELIGPQDLNRLSAEFASDAVAPSALSPTALSPTALSPTALSPTALSPDEFAPSALSPTALSPTALSPTALSEDVISPSALSPTALSPTALSPLVYSPTALSPTALSPTALSPTALSADVYSSAQTRTLVGVSAFEDLADESVIVNTWNNSGDYYVRIRGREGTFDPNNTFTVDVQVISGACDTLYSDPDFQTLPDHSLTIPATSPGLNTLILVDSVRMIEHALYAPADVDSVMANLAELALRTEVNGAVVDVGNDDRVKAINDLADEYIGCATGKNLVADSIKEIIDLYQFEGHDIKYIVLVGNDGIIPFYRYPDNALLGPESDYSPPVVNPSASFTSLQSNMVLSQDRYGADFSISYKDDEIPIPEIPVGRLVENPNEIHVMIDAYMGTTDGVAPTPQSTLVTGYDFLYDTAVQVQAELEAGTGTPSVNLLTTPDLSPLDPESWTAPQLDQLLNEQRYDLMFLAGHFSANSALAADYATALITTDLPTNDEIDLTNSIIFSAGCHAGYNIVYEDRYPGLTFEPDWAQAFAQRGATLIAGTGYQYGDTDFIEYSERIYLEFSKELRTGSGPVAIGDAFVKAKQTYLARTPVMRGIHEKAFLESTIFGLPFLKIDMPGDRIIESDDASIINGTTDMYDVVTNPGATLGLRYTDLAVTPSLTPHALELRNIDNEEEVELIQAYYLEGSDGFLANPGEPVLPLESVNVAVDNLSLRGAGFRGGLYEDIQNVQPLVSAATTELRAVHLAFLSNVFFPLQPWSINYFDTLTSSGNDTRFNVFPAQHLADEPEPNTALLRKFTEMNFRLFYSNNIAEYDCTVLGDCEENVSGNNQPALAAEPTIVSVTGTANAGLVDFEVHAVVNPGVGVQNVWVTYTAIDGPDNGAFYGQWQSLDLVQAVDPDGDVIDSTLWRGSLLLSDLPAADLRFIVQAVSGNGLVSRMDNVGRYYIPGGDIERLPTSILLLSGDTSGKVGQTAVFGAELRDYNGDLFTDQLVGFGLGQETRIVRTGPDGIARTEIPLLARPGIYQLTAWYQGNALYAPSTVSNPRDFQIFKQNTQISLIPSETYFSSPDEEIQMLALLKDVDGRPLTEKTVIYELIPVGGGAAINKAAITDLLGQARLGKVGAVPGVTYDVTANFAGTVSYFPPGMVAAGVLRANFAPLCDYVQVTTTEGKPQIWPTNRKFIGLKLSNGYDLDIDDPDDVSDSPYDVNGDELNYSFLDIHQDELVNGEPDGIITLYNALGTPINESQFPACQNAEVRKERDGNGNGRVYEVHFLVEDGRGGSCEGYAKIATLPHDQGGDIGDADNGYRYNSLGDDAAVCAPHTIYYQP